MQKQHKTSTEKAHTGRLSCLWQKVCLALSFVFIILILVGVLGLNLFSGSFTTNDALSSGALNSSSYLRVVLWLMPDSVTSGDRVYYVEENPDHDETENSGASAMLNALQFYYYEEDAQGRQQKVIVGDGESGSIQKLSVAFEFLMEVSDVVDTVRTVLQVVVGVAAGGLIVTVIYAGCKEYDRIQRSKEKQRTPRVRRRK